MPELNLELESRAGSISPGDLVLTAVEGVVALSDLYRYQLTFMVPGDDGLSPEAQQDLLRSPCRLRFGPAALQAEVSGVLSSLRMRTTATPRDLRSAWNLLILNDPAGFPKSCRTIQCKT